MQQIAGQLGYDEKGIAYSYAPGNYKKDLQIPDVQYRVKLTAGELLKKIVAI